MKRLLGGSIAAVAVLACACGVASAQITTGTVVGSGLGATLGGQDANWKIVALPTGFSPPEPVPYGAFVPTAAPGVFIGGGNPQTGQVFLGGTNYWIAPQNSTASLQPFGVTYNWVAQQQFVVPTAGFYRFDLPGAGDNELEFYIGGTIDSTDPKRPTITGGQQIGGRAGGFGSITTFTGGAQLVAGTNTASMVLWDYGGDTGAIIGSSTFAPTVAYWAPSTGAGGNGTWTNANAYWTADAAGAGSKEPWTSGVGVAYFGGTSGTVTVGETINLTKAYFTTGGYLVQGGPTLFYGTGAEIIASSGTTTIGAPQNVSSRLKVSGIATTRLTGNTFYGFGGVTEVSNGKLLVDGYVGSPMTVFSSGQLGGSGRVDGTISGAGGVNPGASAGILSAIAVNPTDGLDFTFEFSGTIPTFSSASASVNDLLRLTGVTPFATATTPLTSANSKTLFLKFTKAALTLGTGTVTSLKGGFFTDQATDFASFLNNYANDNAGFQVYVLGDGLGTDNSLDGQGYYNWRNPAMFGWDQSLFLSTVPQTADFAGGTVNGQIMLLTVGVPEPSTYALAFTGLACGGFSAWRRRRRP